MGVEVMEQVAGTNDKLWAAESNDVVLFACVSVVMCVLNSAAGKCAFH